MLQHLPLFEIRSQTDSRPVRGNCPTAQSPKQADWAGWSAELSQGSR